MLLSKKILKYFSLLFPLFFFSHFFLRPQKCGFDSFMVTGSALICYKTKGTCQSLACQTLSCHSLSCHSPCLVSSVSLHLTAWDPLSCCKFSLLLSQLPFSSLSLPLQLGRCCIVLRCSMVFHVLWSVFSGT